MKNIYIFYLNMTTILNLPGDMIREIACLLLPWDFRAFRLTNKYIYEHLNIEFYKNYIYDNTEIITEIEQDNEKEQTDKLNGGVIYRYQAELSFNRSIYIDNDGNKFWHIGDNNGPIYEYDLYIVKCENNNSQLHICNDGLMTNCNKNLAYVYYDTGCVIFKIGMLHRLNGPAVEWKNGSADWFEYGICKSPLKKWIKNDTINCCNN